MSKVKFKAIIPLLITDDVVAASEYYRDVLGFEILGYFLEPPVYAMVKRDSAEIHFGKKDSGMIQSNTVLRKASFDVYIIVEDIYAIAAELKNSGAEIVEGPVKRVYGSTEVVVKDCNGYRIVYGD